LDGDEVRATPGRSEMDKSNRIVLHCDMSLGAISAVCLQERNTHKDLADSFILFIFVLTKTVEIMSRTTEQNERTGEFFPKKSRRKPKDKKFFGFREGDGSVPNAVKDEDYTNYGWPSEGRAKSVIKQKIQDELTKKEIEDGN